MADIEAESKTQVLQNEHTTDDSPEKQVKLDFHGFPLRPQPTDDPKGMCKRQRRQLSIADYSKTL